ncbi:molybdate/tungstate transport system ATP-binding protein [Halalkaliarchaeum desulfuricum]|uniref:Molybdate/tungstate import ATP-binding protein WtpC n=1 Tax=Halalkaliarchaeum desulfuricum TaxID=2055893 RepID=A0A343TNS0_9EURY|nr:ABC transporter ATP-binding protein [Halalkaliarchaeum desulfuricum]AUX10742.1 molybdate/tungstate transport system ATP-binding protein [Halalkaliarchaeum desulfuricum]
MILELDDLTHRYGDELAVDGVSIGVGAGELVAVLGPSGCGKTTIVQAVAGHVQPSGGRIRLRGADVTDDPPEARQVGIVFQHSTLFPHLTVEENVEYGLKARDVPPGHREEVVTRFLELVDLPEQREAYPSELSGGQKRRVELARALAPEPDVLLLDEPLSALDRSLRVGLREEIARIQAETGVTTLLVTHDQEEAMSLADRLVVMDDGRVAGIGPPRELYESPPTPFVASFLGRSNALSATLADGTPPTIEIGGESARLPEGCEPGTVTGTVDCHVRPEDVTMTVGVTDGSGDEDDVLSLQGVVRRVADVGRRYDVTVELETGAELVAERAARPPERGTRVEVRIRPADVAVFDSENERV